MQTSSLSVSPNPLTPLAWLPPDIAFQLSVSKIIASTAFGAWTWDFLASTPEEYSALLGSSFNWSKFAYAISRISSFLFITLSLVFIEAGNCNTLAKVIGFFGGYCCGQASFIMLSQSLAT
ncbi:hypothetical protein ABKN59_001774 [Abortiporus biennis]